MKVFVSGLTMPKEVKKDELGILGKIKKKQKHINSLLKITEVETGVLEQPGCQASLQALPELQTQHLTLHREWRLGW